MSKRRVEHGRRYVLSAVGSFLLVLSNVAGCSEIGPEPILPTLDGKVQDALKMCSLCWDRPFCADRETLEFVNEGQACNSVPGREVVPSVPASRVLAALDGAFRREGFHCIPAPIPDPIMAHTGLICPTEASQRSRMEYRNPCLDVPRSCRGPFGCGVGPEPGDPACTVETFYATRTSGCGTDINRARFKASGQHHVFGVQVPTEKPARFCYTSCVGYPCPEGGWDCAPPCNTEREDPPETLPESTLVTLDSANSSAVAVVLAGGEAFRGQTAVGGEFAIDIPATCRGPLPPGAPLAFCAMRLPYISLNGLGAFEIAGKTVDHLELHVPVPIDGTGSISDNKTTFAIGSGVSLSLSANVEDQGQVGRIFNTNSGVLVGIDWITRKVSILATSSDPTGRSSINLFLEGTVPNRVPFASAGGNRTVECTSPEGAAVTLSASGHDPDGDADIASFTWTWRDRDGERLLLARDLTTTAPFGTTRLSVTVSDRAGASDTSLAEVSVVDTTPPTIATTDAFFEVCDSAGAIFDPGQPMIADACDPSPTVDARVVSINGVLLDQPLTSGFRFRQGETVIEFIATDARGNRAVARRIVAVDRGPSCCPAGLPRVVGTTGPDVLNGGNGAECVAGLAGDDILNGGNQKDVLFGGPGNDRLEGGNSGDVLYGGLGDDVLEASNGKDTVLNGGPGDDIIMGGNGKDVIRGGAGRDELYGGKGNDVFVIASACEAPSGEVIDGGEGTDRVESPLTREQLTARGVILRNIEVFVVTPVLADAECVEQSGAAP
jgi:hypothetical protein